MISSRIFFSCSFFTSVYTLPILVALTSLEDLCILTVALTIIPLIVTHKIFLIISVSSIKRERQEQYSNKDGALLPSLHDALFTILFILLNAWVSVAFIATNDIGK